MIIPPLVSLPTAVLRLRTDSQRLFERVHAARAAPSSFCARTATAAPACPAVVADCDRL